MSKKTLIFCLLILQFFLFGNSFAQGRIAEELDSIIQAGIDLVYLDRFDEGIALFKRIVEKYPEEPIGYFFIAASYQTLIDEYRNENFKPDFEGYIDTAIVKAEKKIDEGANSADDHFYMGASYGYRGIYKSFRGNWLGAFGDARKAKSHLDKAQKINPELYDCYIGLGAYHYWGSIKARIFWWLPFIGDDRKKGIQQYKLAIEKGRYAKEEAKYGLLRVYIEEKDYLKALKLGDELKSVNRDDPFVGWMAGQAYIGLERWDEALENYQKLLEYIKSSPYYDLMGEVECAYWLAYVYYRKTRYQKSLEHLGTVLANKDEVKDNDYSEPVLKGAEKLKDKIQELMRKKKNENK
jgi:tetratricopeptide (TPR) repeat protein